MKLKRIFLPENVAKQLQVLPVGTRLELEVCLENLDLLMTNTPRELLASRLAREDDSFVATVEGAAIFFTMDMGLRTAFVLRIDPFPSSRPPTD